MKLLVLVLFFTGSFYTSLATSYYFSSSMGDDARSSTQAQHPSTPWRSLQKLNTIESQLNPGDTIYFKRGDVFTGSIRITRSGMAGKPIVYTAYGSGDKPLITGFTVVTGWVSTGSNRWEASVPDTNAVRMLLYNGIIKPFGRFPNPTDANKGYLFHETVQSKTQFIDNELPASPNWTGAEVVIRKTRWVLDHDVITSHSGSTVTFKNASDYSLKPNFGYFIQNHPSTLDQQGEWYFTANGRKLGVHFGGADPNSTQIKASTADVLFIFKDRTYLTFENLAIQGAGKHAFDIYNSQNITIRGCDISYSGNIAVNAVSTVNLTLEQCTISHTNNIAIHINHGTNTVIRQNKITNTGMIPGMGGNGSGSYEAILIAGNGHTIEMNEIINTGYIAINFSGDNVTIKNNFIDNYTMVKDDGAAIYTWNAPTAPMNTNRKLIGNIILNGKGAGDGTDAPTVMQVTGVYIDQNSYNVHMSGNTVAYSKSVGMYVHNGQNITLENNTLFDNQKQVAMSHDLNVPLVPIRNVNMFDNIFFSADAYQVTGEFRTVANDLNLLGSFDRNYYARPADSLKSLYISYNNGSQLSAFKDLEEWKGMFGKDQSSKHSPVSIAAFRMNGLIGSNKFTNGTFNSNINGISSYSPAGNGKTGWISGKLDGGSLQVYFPYLVNTSQRTTISLPVGNITANKNYILKFSVLGTNENKIMEAYLRKTASPYTSLTVRKPLKITGSRIDYEVQLTPTISEADASLVFEVFEQSNPLYIDNIVVQEASITISNPRDSLRFEYNATNAVKTVSLDGTFIDVKNTVYSNSVTLQPYTSVVLIRRSTTTVPPPAPAVNQAPVANAGPNSTISLPNNATLNGSASTDADGSIIKYQWSQVSGPSASVIHSVNGVTTAVSGLVAGTYTYRLTIWDNKYVPAHDEVIVTVNTAPVATNQLPVANAGIDATITLPATSITLNASSSYDADGSIIKYEWRQVNGPSTSSIASVNGISTAVNNLVQGTYTFALWIWDNKYQPASDQVVISVKAAALSPVLTNQLPVAKAGNDMALTLPVNTAALNGSGTYDSDGSIIKYEWKQVSGPASATLSNVNAVNTTISGLISGTYIIRLTVWDNKYQPAHDELTITVSNTATGSAAVSADRTFSEAPAINVQTSLELFPNPAISYVRISAKAPIQENALVHIHSLNGMLIRQISLPVNTQPTTVDISSLAKGTYLVSMRIQGHLLSQKFIKQ